MTETKDIEEGVSNEREKKEGENGLKNSVFYAVIIPEFVETQGRSRRGASIGQTDGNYVVPTGNPHAHGIFHASLGTMSRVVSRD